MSMNPKVNEARASFERALAEYGKFDPHAPLKLERYDAARRVASFRDDPLLLREQREVAGNLRHFAELHREEAEALELTRTVREMAPARWDDTTEALKASLARWGERFAADPPDALSWGDDTFRDAARLNVARWMQYLLCSDHAKSLSDAGVVAHIERRLRDEVLQRSREVSRSTSPTSNLMDDERRAAFARVYERLVNSENVLDKAHAMAWTF